jgi:hypothetical protein
LAATTDIAGYGWIADIESTLASPGLYPPGNLSPEIQPELAAMRLSIHEEVIGWAACLKEDYYW